MTMHELFDGSDPDLIERRERVIAAAKEVFDYEFQPYTAGYLRIERFYAIAYKAGMERAAEIAWSYYRDGQAAADEIREEAKK